MGQIKVEKNAGGIEGLPEDISWKPTIRKI